jgi:transcriptional regulator with XRE-family HTH domain
VTGTETQAVTRLEQAVARNIRALREANGISQTDLASAVGVTRSSISNIEAGRQNLGITLLGRIADALAVPPADLLKEAGTSPRSSIADLVARLKAAERHARRCDVRTAEAEAEAARARAELLTERALRVKAEAGEPVQDSPDTSHPLTEMNYG